MEVRGGKSVGCKKIGVNCCGVDCCGCTPLAALVGDMLRELLLLSCLERGGCRVGCALMPAAQSGLAGRGCKDGAETLDMYVRRDEDEFVEDDWIKG